MIERSSLKWRSLVAAGKQPTWRETRPVLQHEICTKHEVFERHKIQLLLGSVEAIIRHEHERCILPEIQSCTLHSYTQALTTFSQNVA